MTTAETGPDVELTTLRTGGFRAASWTSSVLDRSAAKITATSPVRTGSLTSVPPLVDSPRIPAPRAEPEPTAAATVPLGESARTRWLTRHAMILAVANSVVTLVATWVALALTSPRPPTSVWVALLVLLPLVWVGTLALGRTFELGYLEDGTEDYRRILNLGIRWISVSGVVALVTGSALARNLTLVAFPIFVVSTLAVHALGHLAQARARRRGVTVHRALVVGTERATAEMIRRLSHRDDHGFKIVGALVERSAATEIEGVPVVGRGLDFRAALDAHGADTLVIAAWTSLSQEELRRMSWELEDSKVDVLVTPNLTDVAGTRISVRPIVGLPLLHVERPEFTGLRRVVKGLFDRVSAGAAMLVLAPFLLVLIVLIKIDSRGPVFYRQARVGRLGSIFPMLKLRTMHHGADQRVEELRELNEHEGGPMFKIKDDPRVTRVGSVLRRFSLDELPQLWNVLRGQMSLVGPRPPLPQEVAQYPDDVHRRLLVKPGLTGLWQVSGRSDLDWDESVRLDLYYVDNWSFLLDLSLIFRTFLAVVSGRGAY
jgi:exopolysaccharide biosynthesis polyprenyl glycosylphosphotransferase